MNSLGITAWIDAAVTGAIASTSPVARSSSEELVDVSDDRLYEQRFNETSLEYWGFPDYQSQYGRRDAYILNTDAVDKQTALFVNLSYKIIDNVKLEVGGRYAFTEFTFNNFTDGNGGRTPGAGTDSEHPFTPKAAFPGRSPTTIYCISPMQRVFARAVPTCPFRMSYVRAT